MNIATISYWRIRLTSNIVTAQRLLSTFVDSEAGAKGILSIHVAYNLTVLIRIGFINSPLILLFFSYTILCSQLYSVDYTGTGKHTHTNVTPTIST